MILTWNHFGTVANYGHSQPEHNGSCFGSHIKQVNGAPYGCFWFVCVWKWMSSFEREWRMEKGLEGRMGWMEGGCWELDAVPVTGASALNETPTPNRNRPKLWKIRLKFNISLNTLFKKLIFFLCYYLLCIYILTGYGREWRLCKKRDFFCHPKVVTFPSFQK